MDHLPPERAISFPDRRFPILFNRFSLNVRSKSIASRDRDSDTSVNVIADIFTSAIMPDAFYTDVQICVSPTERDIDSIALCITSLSNHVATRFRRSRCVPHTIFHEIRKKSWNLDRILSLPTLSLSLSLSLSLYPLLSFFAKRRRQ